MRGVQKSAWGLAALLMAIATPMQAQEPVKARLTADWWWDAGAFGGSMGLSCSVCDGRASGAGAALGGGIRFGRYAEAGLGTTVFLGSREDVSQRLILVGPVGRIYTSTERRWHVRGSLQWQAYRAAEGTSRLTAGTVALGLGLGWRTSVGKTTELAPYADLLVTPSTGLSLNGNDLTNARFNTVVLGAALRFD